MRRKQSRYSSSLATDWVVPSPTEETRAPETSIERELPKASEGHVPRGATQSRSDSIPIPGQPKSSRYKKTFPSNWVTSDAESTSIAAGIESSRGATGEPLLPQPAQLSAQRTSKPVGKILTSRSPRNQSEAMPPPAPTEAIKMSFPIRGVTHQMQREVAQPSSRFDNRRPRSNQRSSFRPLSGSARSTPTSVGQSSSAVTGSPSYGCDQPAMPPSVSPSYSTR